MTIGGETKDARAGDLVVINRGVEHELHSAEGVTFVEALAPCRATTCPIRNVTSFSASRAIRCTRTVAQPRIGERVGASA